MRHTKLYRLSTDMSLTAYFRFDCLFFCFRSGFYNF